VSKIVLCVDDSATMQQVADITFRNTEFQYVGARTVEEGLAKAKAQKPAVVLADAQMPGKNGYDLCLALKSDGATADVPVVILIGNSAPYDAARGAQVGADANLPKPWDTQIMLEKVTEVVAKGVQAKPGQAAAPAPAAAAPSAPARAPAAAKSNAVPAPAFTPSAAPIGGMNRGPMVAGTPTKRSALVERTLAKMAARLAEVAGVEPGSPELLALLKLSTEVVERIVWEVVPDLAEQIIRENLSELSAKRS
jgi:CheY-like chemotaxis protein